MVAEPKGIAAADEEVWRRPPFNVSCPHCGAAPGFYCRIPSGQKYFGTHRARGKKATKKARAEA
jgi:hypothetical protein